jgi:hypothetical protein
VTLGVRTSAHGPKRTHRSATVAAASRGVKRSPRFDRAAAAPDPQRHFAAINCGTAKGLFDHLVGAREQRWRHVEAKRLGGLSIDDKRDFRGLLYG